MPDPLSTTFAALADPTRRAILAKLASGERSVSELAEPFDMSMPAVSKHLKVLERAGLIERGRDAQWRPCRLRARPLEQVADWVEAYRQFWEQSLDRLDDYLMELQGKPKRKKRGEMNMHTMETAMDDRSQDNAEREIRASRLFDAPRSLVWKAWTDPTHVARWWGPNGFTNTIETMTVKPGGIWRLVMHGPDGRDYKNEIVFNEIIEGERIAYTHMSTPRFDAVITFASEGEKTRLSWRMIFATAADRNGAQKGFGAIDGLQQTVSRLDAYLAHGMDAEVAPFVVTRSFDAPRDLVWAVFTDEKHLARWWGPKGFAATYCKLDLRVGGTFHYSLRSPDGMEMWGKWTFEKIVAPEQMVFVSSFSDAAGGVARHPMAPIWPLKLLSRAVFTEAYGRTTLTITWLPIDASEAELRAFDAGRASMTNGWSGTMEQLEAYLASVR